MLNLIVNLHSKFLKKDGQEIPLFVLKDCLSSKPSFSKNICNPLKYSFETFVSKNNQTSWFLITLDIDPLGSEGRIFRNKTYHFLNEQEKITPYKFYLSGLAADTGAAIIGVESKFTLMISITVGVVFIMIGVAFKSILVPIRAIFTISLTIIITFGFATLTYVDGILAWTGVPGLQKSGAIFWLLPILVFAILVGLGLDYDCFLLVRIKEFRNIGYPTNTAVSFGLTKTASIITAAGLIMSIAFGGLFWSSIESLNQLAFYIVFSVLFDTFIVRCFLVPSMMKIFGGFFLFCLFSLFNFSIEKLLKEFNWFPGKLFLNFFTKTQVPSLPPSFSNKFYLGFSFQ